MQYVATVGLSLIFLVPSRISSSVDLYARGAVRDALDEGVRAEAHGRNDAACVKLRSLR